MRESNLYIVITEAMQFEYDLAYLVMTWGNMFMSRAKLIFFMNKLFSLFQTHLQRVRGALPQPHQRLSTCAQGHRIHGVHSHSIHAVDIPAD